MGNQFGAFLQCVFHHTAGYLPAVGYGEACQTSYLYGRCVDRHTLV